MEGYIMIELFPEQEIKRIRTKIESSFETLLGEKL